MGFDSLGTYQTFGDLENWAFGTMGSPLFFTSFW